MSAEWLEVVFVGGPHDGKNMAISKAPHKLYMPDVPPCPLNAGVAAYCDGFDDGILTYHRCGVDSAGRCRYVLGDHGPICASWLVKP